MGGERRRCINTFNGSCGLAGAQRDRGQHVGRLLDHIAGRGGHRDFVGSGHQAGEGHVAVGIGDGGFAGCAASRVQQRDGHAGEVALTRALGPVGIAVEINMGGERRRCINTFNSSSGAASCHAYWSADVGALRDDVASRLGDRYLIAARSQAGEGHITIRIGDCGLACRATSAVEQRDGHAGKIGLPCALGAVGIAVEINMSAERAHATAAAAADNDQTSIDVRCRRTGRHSDRRGNARRRVRGGAGKAGRTGGLCGEPKAGGLEEFNLVAARSQILEGIIATGIGRGGCQYGRTSGVQQFDRHAGLSHFAALVDAVAVQVEPSGTADRGGRYGRRQEALIEVAEVNPGCRSRGRSDREGQRNIHLQRAIRPGERDIPSRGRASRIWRGEVDGRTSNNHAVAGQRFNRLQQRGTRDRVVIGGDGLLKC